MRFGRQISWLGQHWRDPYLTGSFHFQPREPVSQLFRSHPFEIQVIAITLSFPWTIGPTYKKTINATHNEQCWLPFHKKEQFLWLQILVWHSRASLFGQETSRLSLAHFCSTWWSLRLACRYPTPHFRMAWPPKSSVGSSRSHRFVQS
jgi:hypothetical protein